MPESELLFISSQPNEMTTALSANTKVDFKTLSPELLIVIQALNPEFLGGINNIKSSSIARGFNTTITGGGIHRLSFDQPDRVRSPQSLILKAIPPFVEQQQAMFQLLEQIGEREFIDILAPYPSNKLTKREILSYQLLNHTAELRIPKLFLGILDQITEQAWIFMEDLSYLSSVTTDIYHWRTEMMTQVIKNMAAFHTTYWNGVDELVTHEWLGHWWSERNNDFVAEDVTTYALDRCAVLHPKHLTPKRLSILRRAIMNRPATHALFLQHPQTLIHWDHGPHNMRATEGSKKTEVALLDWELTSVGLPQWDLAQFLLPILGGKNAVEIDSFIDLYLSVLPIEITQQLNVADFKHLFDQVVMDHFFRVCGPILFGGEQINENSYFFKEWVHCLEWIELKLS